MKKRFEQILDNIYILSKSPFEVMNMAIELGFNNKDVEMILYLFNKLERTRNWLGPVSLNEDNDVYKKRKINSPKIKKVEKRFVKKDISENKKVNKGVEKDVRSFLKSASWRKVRYEALRRSDGKCCVCGKSKKDGIILHCDHIIPISVDWDKRLDIDNLQIMCSECNLGKGNTDCIRWGEK